MTVQQRDCSYLQYRSHKCEMEGPPLPSPFSFLPISFLPRPFLFPLPSMSLPSLHFPAVPSRPLHSISPLPYLTGVRARGYHPLKFFLEITVLVSEFSNILDIKINTFIRIFLVNFGHIVGRIIGTAMAVPAVPATTALRTGSWRTGGHAGQTESP